jgi:hypothetical protein
MTDTSPEAERVLIDICRNMSVQDKWRRLQSLYRTGRNLHEMGFRRRFPNATSEEVVDDWMKLTLDTDLYWRVREFVDGPV